jgi:F-type H+-transporting ATPase subunit b
MSVWTYIAQIVNFLVFVVILYLLLYKPVRRIMQQRRDEMEAERREAETKLQEAEKLRAEAEASAKELEEKRDSILKEAREQAEAQRKELLEQAEQQARDRLQRFRRIMEQERDELLDKISDELRETIVETAGAVLSDTSGAVTDRALERVETLLDGVPDEDVQSARKALDKSGNRVPVRFVGTLTDDQLDRLRTTLRRKLDVKNIELEVTEDPSLLAGLEVTLGHIQLEAHWRGVIDRSLAKERRKPQEKRDEPKPKAKAKPEAEEKQTNKG